MENIVLKASDGYALSLAVFEREHPRGYIQIIHGMEEHKERYEAFAEQLRQAGFTVVTSDMRGHGEHAPKLGFFKEKDGDRYLLSDQVQITAYIRERFQTEKVMIFAHSMGTIIARNLLCTQSHSYAKVVLGGFPNYPGTQIIRIGFFLTNLLTRARGPMYHSKLVQQLSVGNFNKQIKHAKTEVDWICSDEQVVQAYLKDPYCGHGFSVSAFHDLYMLTTAMHQVSNYRDVNEALPILMIRGSEDPCTGYEKGAKDSVDTLKQAGFSNISTITYPHMRHEILNEKENEKVYADVIAFYEKT